MIQAPIRTSSSASASASASSTDSKRLRCALLLSSALLALAPTSAAAAEPAKEPSWYQIELVVFTQPRADLHAEYWQEQHQPRFASNAIQLQPSAGFASEQPSHSSLDTAADAVSDAASDAASDALIADPQALPIAVTAAGLQNPRLVRELRPPLLQEYSDAAFTLLDPAQQPRSDETLPPINTVQLQRRGHRILFQGQWHQPVHARAQARSVVIRGGQPLTDNYFELEGDIELSLSRYLHLRPNLYFTQALPPAWQPRHPRAIEALASTPSVTTTDLSAAAALDSAALPIPLPATDAAFQSPAQPSVQPQVQLLSQPAPIQYLTVRLDQPRRMRRNELHYLDHPLFGLLIRLTPFTPEPKRVEIPVTPSLSVSPANVSMTQPE